MWSSDGCSVRYRLVARIFGQFVGFLLLHFDFTCGDSPWVTLFELNLEWITFYFSVIVNDIGITGTNLDHDPTNIVVLDHPGIVKVHSSVIFVGHANVKNETGEGVEVKESWQITILLFSLLMRLLFASIGHFRRVRWLSFWQGVDVLLWCRCT